jgi:glycosyltransferase involved in cell wall biosynthesis
MYCGSCLRDNALAAELKRQGHDIVLLPLYTPTRTDEANVSEPKVFLNGISVCLCQEAAFFRRPHPLLDRLWDAPWMLKLASQTSIRVNPHSLGAMTVSMLRGEDGNQRKDIRKLTAWLRSEAPPDIVTLPNSLLIGLARPVREALRRPVCCTLQGEELFLNQLPEPYRTQALELIRAKVEDVDGFVAVSEFSADYWQRQLGIPGGKLRVVPLGIDPEGYGPPSRVPGAPFRVGFFARVAPEKGLELLAESYLRLRRESDFGGSALEAAGYLAPEHHGYLRGVERRMKEAGLAHEFHFSGELDRAGKIRVPTQPQRSERSQHLR